MPKDKHDDSEHTFAENEKQDQKTDLMSMVKINTITVITFLLALIIHGIRKFWALCSTFILILLLLYWLYGGIFTLLLILVAVLGLLYNIQDKLLYYPEQPPTARLFVESPSILGLPFENLFVKTCDGVRINLVLIKAPVMTKAPTVIFFHGNAGNVGHRLVNAYSLVQTSGCNVLLVEYRGYGKSCGSPNESGLYKDAGAAMDFLLARQDIDHERIVVFGRSLGGAVAIQLASSPQYTNKIACLIVENTFTSLPEIGRHIFDIKLIHYLPNWCIKNKYPSCQLIRKVHMPTLFLSGIADTLIPPKMMHVLYHNSTSNLKRLARFEGGTHNETWQCSGYYESINRFLQEVEESKRSEILHQEGSYTIDVPFNDGGVRDVFVA